MRIWAKKVGAPHGTLLDCLQATHATLIECCADSRCHLASHLDPSVTVFKSAQGRSAMHTRFNVVDETDHELSVQCEINGLAGKVIWEASIYDASSLQAVLNGEAVDQDAVAGHVQAEVLDRGIFARS
jgi:hypothetical protein